MDEIEYPKELPDYNNNSRGQFTGRDLRTESRRLDRCGPWGYRTVRRSLFPGSFTTKKLLNGSKPNSFYLNTHESETLLNNQQFILNAGSKITDIAWIKGMAQKKSRPVHV